MSLRADRREWDDLARRDALWAIASVPGKRGSWELDEFMATGDAEVAAILLGLEQAGIAVGHGRALDFGCGVGRLTRALAGRFDEAVGVDISAEMVSRADALNADMGNCRFFVNDSEDLAVLPTGGFDLVLSLIALQHVSSRRVVRSYLRELVRVTRPGGVVVVQLPSRIGLSMRAHPLRVANRVLRTLPVAPSGVLERLMPWSMGATGLPEGEVRGVLEGAGADVVTAFDDRRTGLDAMPSRAYVATVRPRPGTLAPP